MFQRALNKLWLAEKGLPSVTLRMSHEGERATDARTQC
jgi:hypothetical protein